MTDQDTEYMDRTLMELMHVNLPRDIGIAGWLSTTTVTGPLIFCLDKLATGEDPVYNFVLRLKPGGFAPKRFEVLKQLSPKAGLDQEQPVTEVLRYIRNLYEYEHVILTTWDHGSGFAFFAEPDPFNQRQQPPAKKVAKKAARPVRKPEVRNLTELRARLTKKRWLASPYGLTMVQLQNAIFKSFGKVDVIFMRNCFMQLFDTCMIMRDVADYLVACESMMWFEAYDYTVWLRAMLRAGKGLTPEGVTAAAITGFKKAKLQDKHHRTDTAIFGNELSYFGAVNEAMNRMILQLIYHVKGHKAELIKCRHDMTEIQQADWSGADFQLVDARNWFERAGKLLRDNKEYQEALRDFLALHKRLIGDRYYVGKKLKAAGYGESGFSIYFPPSAIKIAASGSFFCLYYTRLSANFSPVAEYSLWRQFLGYLFLDIPPTGLKQAAKRLYLKPVH